MSRGGQQKAMPKPFVDDLVDKLNRRFERLDIRYQMARDKEVDSERTKKRAHEKAVKKTLAKADDDVDVVRGRLINSMSNWQRHQWARDGYSQKLKVIKQFAEMERRVA